MKYYSQLLPKLFLKCFTGAVTGLLLLLIDTGKTQAQTRGKLEIIKDSRIDTLIARRSAIGKNGGKAAGSGISSYGYRVQFFSGANRKDAFSAQNRFQRMHPELRTYINYKEPNFKIKGGDFRSRLEATKLVEELKGLFSPLYIISERINMPKLDINTTAP
ncbi:SPOR domain-containing protein [Mucilaginibacter sp. CSA2-8R]|uniref:SPOR domain-containing protein n=1 Tax=Mucilaginibacter sp. CSA2-8R TaxID=3141542 RepID=UPI00315D9C08